MRGVFLPHVRGHLKKLHLKMRGVFFVTSNIPTTSAEGIRKKLRLENAWCFIAPSDSLLPPPISHHVRAQASGKIASRKVRRFLSAFFSVRHPRKRPPILVSNG
jgi:hypothetical protein